MNLKKKTTEKRLKDAALSISGTAKRMRYQEIKPAPFLAAHVECFWIIEGKAAESSVTPERLLPDGCIELILNVGARFREFDATHGGVLQPERFVVGQMTRPVLIAPTGLIALLGIRFAPGGTLPFLPALPNELTDRITPLGDLAVALEQQLLTALQAADTWVERVSRIEALLIRCFLASRRKASLQPLLFHFIKSGGLLSVENLAEKSGLSRRELERRFLREVGLSPKLFGRILRFQQVFRAVERMEKNWAGIAVECGYYDQAHLIKDFHQFAGQTPGVLLDDFSRFTEMFTRKNRASHFSNTVF